MNDWPNRGSLVALLASLFVPVVACQGPDAAATPSSADSPARLSLTSAQSQALSELGQMLHRPADGLPATNAYGGTRLDLQGGFQHAVMVERNPDGTFTFLCTDSIDTATDFLTRPTPVKADEK